MKQLLLTFALIMCVTLSFGQNINDNKITFNYIQLPLLKIESKYDAYKLSIEHAYLQANEDSTMMFEARQNVAMEMFQAETERYHRQRDSIDRLHLEQMAQWEKQVNAGVTAANGTALPQPVAPAYPQPPVLDQIDAPILHSDFQDNIATDRVKLEGYSEGDNQVEITVTIHPIRNIRITSEKKGTGASTKYNYKAHYVLPIGLRVANPSQGIMMEVTLYENELAYGMPSQKSQYDHELYMMDNQEVFFRQLETHARQLALTKLNDHLNNHFGFVKSTRTAEIYSVKSHKGHDYSDVTNAFTKTTLALQAVGDDRDRSGAIDKINLAINNTEAILTESNLSDRKARINDKITAMLQCNLAELYMWKADFDKCDGLSNLVENSGEGKARRHIKGERAFYSDQRNRWDVHY